MAWLMKEYDCGKCKIVKKDLQADTEQKSRFLISQTRQRSCSRA